MKKKTFLCFLLVLDSWVFVFGTTISACLSSERLVCTYTQEGEGGRER